MNTNKEQVKKLLLERNIRPTFPRLKVLEYLLDTIGHPTVDEMYRHIIKEIPTISKTTIYNTLQMLVKDGLVLQLMSGPEARYDAILKSHHHFVCDTCSRVIDIDIACPNVCRKEIDGHQIKAIQGYFLGTCARCRAKSGKNNG